MSEAMIQLWLSDALLLGPGKYQWTLDISEDFKKAKTIKLNDVDLTFAWDLWTNLTLAYTQGGPLTTIINGSWDATNLGGYLQTLFANCTSCTLDLSTFKISFMFSVPTTLNISQWNIRAQMWLGAGKQDIASIAGVINLPFKYNLGGDTIIKMHSPFSRTDMIADQSADIMNIIPIPVDVNPGESFFYQPEDYYLFTSGSGLKAKMIIKFTDKWMQPLDFAGVDGFISIIPIL
jgi:hypothetical protein